jgi:hypothetical protein
MALPAWIFTPEEIKRIRAQNVQGFKIQLDALRKEEAACQFCDASRDLNLGGEVMCSPVCFDHQEKRHALLD